MLAAGIPVGLALLVLLCARLSRLPEPSLGTASPMTIGDLLIGHRQTVGLLLLIGVLRVIPAVGILQTLAFVLKGRGESNAAVGMAQATFQIASTAGAFGCAFLARRVAERWVLCFLPLVAAPALVACGLVPYGGLLALLAVSGIFLGGAGPVLISYGQQLLPNGQRIASSLTLGVSWGLGGAVVAGLMMTLNHVGRPDVAFWIFGPVILLSCALCLRLPTSPSTTRPSSSAWATARTWSPIPNGPHGRDHRLASPAAAGADDRA